MTSYGDWNQSPKSKMPPVLLLYSSTAIDAVLEIGDASAPERYNDELGTCHSICEGHAFGAGGEALGPLGPDSGPHACNGTICFRIFNRSGRMDGLLQRSSQLKQERDSCEAKLQAIEGILKPEPSIAQGPPKFHIDISKMGDDFLSESLEPSTESLFDFIPGYTESQFPLISQGHIVPELGDDLFQPMTDSLQREVTTTSSEQQGQSDPESIIQVTR